MFEKLKSTCKDQAFLGLLILGLVLLCQNLWVPGFFQDGYIYAAFGKNAAEKGHWLIPHLSPYVYKEFFQHLPLPFMLEGLFFKIFPANYTTARLYGVLFPLGILVIMYHWLKGKDKNWAFISGFLFLLIPAMLKKSRFPNTDTPMMMVFFLFALFYWQAFERDRIKDWLLAGLFFGLAILIKGPFGLFLPGIVFLHQIFANRGRALLGWKAWVALLLGAGLFSLWPISLALIGRIDAFTTWADSTFMHNMLNERQFQGTHFYDYIVFMLKQLPHLFILYLIAAFKYGKSLKTLPGFLILFFGMYIFMISLIKVKYSNYLMMSYPFIAMCAGYFVCKKYGDKLKNLIPWVKGLGIIAALVFAIFPVAKEIRRDPDVYKLLSLTRALNNPPRVWLLTEGVYPYYAMANLLAFEGDAHLYNIGRGEIPDIVNNKLLNYQNEFKDNFSFAKKSWLILLRVKTYNDLPIEIKEKTEILAHFQKYDFYAVMPKINSINRQILSF